MSWTPAKDISQWQGNWQDTGEPIVFMKCGGGDAGLYYDAKCTENYNGATKAGRAVGLYWFTGWQLGAEQEAAFFLKAVSPLAENDVYAIDIEKAQVPVPANAVQYVTDMANYIHENTGAWPLLYMNLSTLNQFDWSAILKNCGLWLADWAVSPDANIPTHYTYVMQQYNDGPNYDHDAFFGSVEQFKAYGYHAVKPAPPQEAPSEPTTPTQSPTEPDQTPATPNEPTSTDTPSEPSDTSVATEPVDSTPEPPAKTPTPPKVIVPEPTYYRIWDLIVAILKKLFLRK